MLKRFSEWMQFKEKLHNIDTQMTPHFNEMEIWWCSFGDNIGSEINGKSNDFARPVLIFKQFSRDGFFGLPMTSKIRKGTWFISVSFQSQNYSAVLNQGRTLNARRLRNRIGCLGKIDAEKIKVGFRRLYLDDPSL